MNNPFGRHAAVRAALQMTGSTYVTYATGLLTSVFIARSIGPADFGRYSYLVWLAGILMVVATNGLTTSAIRFVSESIGRGTVDDARKVHGWLKRRQFACIGLVVVVYLLTAPFFRPAGWNATDIYFLAAIVLVSAIAKALFLFEISIAKGYGRFDIEAASSVAVSVLNVGAVLVLAAMHASLIAYLLLFSVSNVLYTVIASLMMRRGAIVAEHGTLDGGLLRRIREHLGWTIVLTVSGQFSNKSIETYLLNALIGPAEVGFFAIAAALTRGGIDLLCSGLSTVLMPSMAHAFGAGGHARVNTILSQSVRYFQFLGLMLAGVGFFWADAAVKIMYGPKYEPVIDLLRIMVAVGGLTLAEAAFGALLSTTDNQRLRASLSIISIFASTLAALVMIPLFGLMGAVYGHAISRLATFAYTVTRIMRVMHLEMPWRELGRLFLAALIAAAAPAVLMVLGAGNVWIDLAAGALFGLTYLGLTLLLRAWTGSDSRHAAALLERFPRLAGVGAWLEARAADGPGER
ncbi:MAG TPA: oligosaccharide flippase family protein [Rhodanobacteraceae bacterium]|nr:oligosaccharide flippase family protein [Rhodanobacteraceae bacterium]